MFQPTALRERLVVLGVFLATSVATCSTAKVQDLGNRREGTSVHVDPLEDFTLLSGHRNFESSSHNSKPDVCLLLPKLPDNPKRDSVMEAVERQDSVHSLMQSKNAPSKEGSRNVGSGFRALVVGVAGPAPATQLVKKS